jgi:hypothetical protein
LWKNKGLSYGSLPRTLMGLSLSRTFHGRRKVPHLFDNFMCVLFLLFFLGEEGPCVSHLGPFCGGGVLWRGRGIGASNFGLCVCVFGGLVYLRFIFWICNCYFVRKGDYVYHTCFFSFLFNRFDVAGDWTSIHKRN